MAQWRPRSASYQLLISPIRPTARRFSGGVNLLYDSNISGVQLFPDQSNEGSIRYDSLF